MMSFVISAILGVIMLVSVLSLAAFHTWLERKQSAVIQDRIGANRAWIVLPWKWAAPVNWILGPINRLGLFHTIADAIKMFMKEDYIPPFGDRFLHTLAPTLSLTFALVGFAAIPFGDMLMIQGREYALQVAPVNVALLYVFAMMSMGVYGVVLAGFSSNSNYSFLGGMRAASQMLAYEITLGATIVGIVLVYGSLDLQEVVRRQGQLIGGWIPMWGAVTQPLGLLLFMAAGFAETKRAPFDLPEGESEIVGYFTEYSSMKFGMFFFADFIETIMIACLVTTLFFGGWQIPYLLRDGFHFPWGAVVHIPYLWVAILGVLAFSAKMLFFCVFFMTVRWTFPRFRYDQLMDLGWKVIFPLSVLNIFVTAVVLLWWR